MSRNQTSRCFRAPPGRPRQRRLHSGPGVRPGEPTGSAAFLAVVVTLVLLFLLATTILPGYLEDWASSGTSVAGLASTDGAGRVMHRALQERTLDDMRAIATANEEHLAETGAYAEALFDLEAEGLLVPVPRADGWGNAWIYASDGDTYQLVSRGADGVEGPEPPDPWPSDVFEPDLVLQDGDFLQLPS